MRKVLETKSIDVHVVRLYREEMDELIALLRRAKARDIEIRIGDYTLDPGEGLDQLPRVRFRRFEIVSTSPYVSVSTGRHYFDSEVSVYSSSQDLEVIAVTKLIRDVLERSRSSLWWVSRIWFALLFIGLIAAQAGNNVLINSKDSVRLERIGLVLAVSGVVLMLVALPVWPFWRSRFTNTVRLEADSFWKRNKDAIAVGVLTGLIGTILGVLGTLFVQSLD